MSRVERITFSEDSSTVEIYSSGVEFALLARQKGEWFQAMTFVHCKDFLHDVVWSTLHKKAVDVHDLKYDGSSNPIYLRKMALAFRNRDFSVKESQKTFHRHLKGCQDFLQQVDRQLGFRPTKIHRVKHTKGACWLILADRRWMLAPPLLSMYSLLTRVGYYHNPGGDHKYTLEAMKNGELGGCQGEDDYDFDSAGSNDAKYVGQAWKGIQAILKYGADIFHSTMLDNYPVTSDFENFHDQYGIINFTKAKPKKDMPEWYASKYWK